MLALDYMCAGDPQGAMECMRNIHLAKIQADSEENPYYNLLRIQTDWEKLMDFFSSKKVASEAKVSVLFQKS